MCRRKRREPLDVKTVETPKVTVIVVRGLGEGTDVVVIPKEIPG